MMNNEKLLKDLWESDAPLTNQAAREIEKLEAEKESFRQAVLRTTEKLANLEMEWIPVHEVTEPGWYWVKNDIYSPDPTMRYIRSYCFNLAIDNNLLKESFKECKFSGPLAPPIQEKDGE